MLKVMMPFDINSIKGTLSYANTKEVAMRKGVDIKCVDSIKSRRKKVYFVLPSTQKVQMSGIGKWKNGLWELQTRAWPRTALIISSHYVQARGDYRMLLYHYALQNLK